MSSTRRSWLHIAEVQTTAEGEKKKRKKKRKLFPFFFIFFSSLVQERKAETLSVHLGSKEGLRGSWNPLYTMQVGGHGYKYWLTSCPRLWRRKRPGSQYMLPVGQAKLQGDIHKLLALVLSPSADRCKQSPSQQGKSKQCRGARNSHQQPEPPTMHSIYVPAWWLSSGATKQQTALGFSSLLAVPQPSQTEGNKPGCWGKSRCPS